MAFVDELNFHGKAGKGGDGVVPIPGTSSVERLAENFAAKDIVLSQAEVAEIEAAVPEAKGDRYTGMHGTFNKKKAPSPANV